MRTAIDTSVLRDVSPADPLFCDRSLDAIRRSLAEGPLLACDVVWAEVIAAFPDPAAAEAALSRLPVVFSGMSQAAATKAGIAWRAYRQAGGPRERLMTDFVVGVGRGGGAPAGACATGRRGDPSGRPDAACRARRRTS